MSNENGLIQERQIEGEIVLHEFNDVPIPMRLSDGYINGTAICKANDKKIGHYFETDVTLAFLHALSDSTGIAPQELRIIQKGGDPLKQGTWVHPQVAINLGQWASPEFAVLVSKWVFDWMLRPTNDVVKTISSDIGSTQGLELDIQEIQEIPEINPFSFQTTSENAMDYLDKYLQLREIRDKRASKAEKVKLVEVCMKLLTKCNALLD